MKLLTVIPARRDSKGIPGKNWKLLNGKPLIGYSIESALAISAAEDICISTNAEEVINIAEKEYGLSVPFIRPEELSSDISTSRSVKLHALDFYESNYGKKYDAVLLLQPTSPFRKASFIPEAIDVFKNNLPDMVVSVYESNLNPYYNLYTENKDGQISRAISSSYTRRQDCPPVYAINGSIYVISVEALRALEIHDFKRVIKYVMPEQFSIDLDNQNDWNIAEYFISKNMFI